MAVKKSKLELNDSSRETFCVGMVSVEVDYKLVWQLNNQFALSFQQKENKVDSDFPSYLCIDDFDNEFVLIANKSKTSVLLQALKNIDYVFQVCYDSGTLDIESIRDGLRNIEGVTAVLPIDAKNEKLIKKLC